MPLFSSGALCIQRLPKVSKAGKESHCAWTIPFDMIEFLAVQGPFAAVYCLPAATFYWKISILRGSATNINHALNIFSQRFMHMIPVPVSIT